MDGPVPWIVGAVLLFGCAAVARLAVLLTREGMRLARRLQAHAGALERAAEDLRTQVRLTGDRAARLTRRTPRV